MRFGADVVTFDQVFEIIVVAFGVVVWVHGHKTGVLQKAWIDTAPCAREFARHFVNHIVFKPVVAFIHGQVVDGSRRFTCVNRAAHHGHGQGCFFIARSHQRHSGQHRHRGLANAHYMAVAVFALHMADAVLHIVDVVIQIESTFGQRHETCVFPVGDIDLVVFEHGFDGIAQQRCVVARKRRYDQHDRMVLDFDQRVRIVGQALKTQQIAKGSAPLDALVNRHLDAIDLYGTQAELGLFVVFSQAVHQLIARRHTL